MTSREKRDIVVAVVVFVLFAAAVALASVTLSWIPAGIALVLAFLLVFIVSDW